MTHAEAPLRPNPEDRFDHWLDGLVAGTPADATSLNGTDGSLGRAMSGARQLHGLAAGTDPAAAAQRRIEEDLMRSGTLAAPRGTTWIPIEKEARRTPWWSPTSPVIAAALVVALIVTLGASFIATQRPAEAPTPAPGFAMASPSAMEPTPVSSLPILVGEPGDGVRSYFGAYGVIDKAGLTITRPGKDDLVFPGVSFAVPYGVPGEAMLVREDGTRFVADLTTGETRFNLPNTTERQVQVGTYLFVSETGENADWTVWDLRTGDSRPLSEIVDLPAHPPAIPVLSGIPFTTDSDTVAMHFMTPEFETSPLSDVPSFLIAGSVDNAVVLEGYPPATQVVDQSPAISDDRIVAAWITTGSDPAIVVVEVATGDTLARFDVSVLEQHPQIAGFLNDGETLVVTTSDQILLLSWAGDSREQQIVAEGLDGIGNPLLYPPTGSLYFVEDGVVKRITIPDADITVAMPEDSAQAPLHFTAPGTPWIITNEGGNAALIDARTGEVVSELRDVPANPAEFGAYSTTTSSDGSTLMFQQGGLRTEYTAWLVSPRFPDGLSFTAPLDAAMIEPDQTFPVMFSVSPDGSEILVGTVGDTGLTPRLIGQVAPDPAWVQVDGNLSGAYWLPMPATEDKDADTQTLPAQDFATPAASPAAEGLSCASPGYLPVVSGDLDTADLATIGAPGQIIRVTDDGVTVPLPGGGETTLPAGAMPVTSVPGTYGTVEDDGSRTITSIPLDETWAFPALDFSDTGSDAGPAAFSFVATGPYVAGPVDTTGLDWRVVNVRTGEEVTTSELLDGLFPWMVVPQSAPRSDSDLQAITFIRATQSMPEITSEVVAPEGDATDRALNGTVAAILPGSLEHAAIVDLGGITPLMGPIVTSAVVYNNDGTLAAWRGWEDNGEDEGFFTIAVAKTSDLATPLVQLGITSPPASVDPLAFSPDGSEMYVRDGMTIQALNASDGTLREIFTTDADLMNIQAINANAETMILKLQGANDVDHMQTYLLDLTTGEARHLPELDGFSATYTPLADTDLDLAQSIMLATYSDTGSDDHRVTFQRIVNTATGEIVVPQPEPVIVEAGDDRLVTATGASGAGFVVGVRPDGTLGVLDGNTARSWTLTPPADVDLRDEDLLPDFHISPSGSCLLLTVDRVTGNDGDRILTEHVGSWIAPLEPDAEWTKLPFALDDWWPVPTDEQPAIPTREATSPATPVTSLPKDEFVTGITVSAKDGIYVSITVDGLPVFEGDLAAGQSTETLTGSEFEVYTTSGENTLFTNSCGTPPFNMGNEPGEAYYILKADAASCPPATPGATPAASPAASESCATTAPNGDIPPGENAGLDWLGSGASDPSLWLMMTWDDGIYSSQPSTYLSETGPISGHALQFAIFRDMDSGDIRLSAVDANGQSIADDRRYLYPEYPTPKPGIDMFTVVVPSTGCWTVTATDGDDTLTWRVNVTTAVDGCNITQPNGAMPPNTQYTDPEGWLGSETENPSLWLYNVTGRPITPPPTFEPRNRGGISVKTPFWRGEGSGPITLTGERLDQSSPFEPRIDAAWDGYPMPGMIATGIWIPTEGCWRLTATDGNDTLTWTVLVQSPFAGCNVTSGADDDGTIPRTVIPPSTQPPDPDDYYGENGLYITIGDPVRQFPFEGDLVSPDGAISDKFVWYREGAAEGELSISVENTTQWFPDEPVINIPSGYGASGVQASGITFPGPGCWQITGTSGDVSITFTVRYEIIPGEDWLPPRPSSDVDAVPAPDIATPAATPAPGASCATTPPNGDVPPGENAGLDWLGSGASDPSLWLMMTWDDGAIQTNQIADGYPVKLTFWRGEGSGEIEVTATGPDGETLPAGTFEPFRGTTIPGIHPMGGTLPEPGCWTFTATDGNDSLTWTVVVQSIEATPAASPAASPVAEG